MASTAVDIPTVKSNFGKTLAVAKSPKSWLTTAETSQAQRPSIKEFMDRSKAPFLDASELIYGVVGSNTDVRDWSAIMASDDPISAARQATGQMYGRTHITPRTVTVYLGAGQELPRCIDGLVFSINGSAVSKAWDKALERAQISDFHFHDLRHMAITQMARKLPNIIELSTVSGHKSLAMLKSYYHPKAADLSRKLG